MHIYFKFCIIFYYRNTLFVYELQWYLIHITTRCGYAVGRSG